MMRRPAIGGEYYGYCGRGPIRWEPDALTITPNVIGDYSHYRRAGRSGTKRG